jgi:hypothetical protein
MGWNSSWVVAWGCGISKMDQNSRRHINRIAVLWQQEELEDEEEVWNGDVGSGEEESEEEEEEEAQAQPVPQNIQRQHQH